MTKILLAAVALIPLTAGAALAECTVPQGAANGGAPSKCEMGPFSYADWEAQWNSLRGAPMAQFLGLKPPATSTVGAKDQAPSQPNS